MKRLPRLMADDAVNCMFAAELRNWQYPISYFGGEKVSSSA